jgi:hypothetical protein
MDENRLVTLILAAAFVLGSIVLGVFYLTAPDSMQAVPEKTETRLASSGPVREVAKPAPARSSMKPSPKNAPSAAEPAQSIPRSDRPEEKDSKTKAHGLVTVPEQKGKTALAVSPGPPTEKGDGKEDPSVPHAEGSDLEFSVASTRAPGADRGVPESRTKTVDENRSRPVPDKVMDDEAQGLPREETGVETVPDGPAKVLIREEARVNGSFKSAQEISEGMVVGKRGSERDLSDFYVIRSTGTEMILRLDPPMEDEKSSFRLLVYDGARRLLSKTGTENRSAVTVPATLEGTYYFQLDLRNAPVGSPGYGLHVKFQ